MTIPCKTRDRRGTSDTVHCVLSSVFCYTDLFHNHALIPVLILKTKGDGKGEVRLRLSVRDDQGKLRRAPAPAMCIKLSSQEPEMFDRSSAWVMSKRILSETWAHLLSWTSRTTHTQLFIHVSRLCVISCNQERRMLYGATDRRFNSGQGWVQYIMLIYSLCCSTQYTFYPWSCS